MDFSQYQILGLTVNFQKSQLAKNVEEPFGHFMLGLSFK